MLSPYSSVTPNQASVSFRLPAYPVIVPILLKALETIGLTLDDLYEKGNLVEMLLIYPINGNYARLTTKTDVQLTTDLTKVDAAALKADYKKFASVIFSFSINDITDNICL